MDNLGSSTEKATEQRAAIEGERKQVTVLFVDIVRSMELIRSVDIERWGVVLDRFLAIACRAIEGLEGSANQFHGDGLMAIFGAPVAHEDHARRACLAALELQRRVAPLADELKASDDLDLRLRCGVNSDEVVVGSIGGEMQLDFAPIGNAGGVAKRVEEMAPEGSVALSAATAALVRSEFELRDLGEFELKGVGEAQRVYELLGVIRDRDGARWALRRSRSRFVGRDVEREALVRALEQAVDGAGGAIGIRGEPGVGKSRLLHEFTQTCRAGGLRVDTARALAHGRAVPLLPILELLRSVFDVEEGDEPAAARARIQETLAGLDPGLASDLPLLIDFLGLTDSVQRAERIDPDARSRRLLSLVGGIVEARGRREPSVLAIEDLHWMDEASTAFVKELAQRAVRSRTLLVATFRPEYEDGWTGGGRHKELVLRPLDREASAELVHELVGEDPSVTELSDRVCERTSGNPFFIEEVVQGLEESGHLVGRRGRYRLVAGDELLLPATVQATLDARIDRLPAREKSLLRTMSVIGKDVDRAVLEAVASLDARDLEEALSGLMKAEFVLPGRSSEELAFKHPLTQEVAYASQLSTRRADLHAAVAAAIEELHADDLDTHASLLARHLELAGEALRAAQWHARAATWLLVPFPAESAKHWQRVRELTATVDGELETERLGVLAASAILGIAWRIGMPDEEAAAIHADARLRAASSELIYESVLLDVAYAANLGFGGGLEEGLALARHASADAESIGDPGLVLNANASAALAAWLVGALAECVELVDRALAIAGDDVGAGAGFVIGHPYVHCFWIRGSGRMLLGHFKLAEQDITRCLELAAAVSDPLCALSALSTRALLHLHNLEPDEGVRDARRALEMSDRIGDTQTRVAVRAALAYVEGDAGAFATAVETALAGLDIIRTEQVGIAWRPELLAAVAKGRAGLGETEEALAAAEEAVAIADMKPLRRSRALCRFALARVLIAAGGAAPAEIEKVLKKAETISAEIGYRAAEPLILCERANLARSLGEDAGAEGMEAEARRIVARWRAGKPT